jgi:hypothetical protein
LHSLYLRKEISMTEPVYKEIKHKLVQSSHGDKNTHYRVFLGYVNWRKIKDAERPAIVIFMQYGNTPNWEEAKKHEIALQMPAHILVEDLQAVMDAINQLNR